MRERRRTGNLGEDLLGMLLEARDETTGESMTDVQIRDEILTMLIAGHETVAAALTWSWCLLAQNLDSQRRLHEEAVSVLGDRDPTGADVTRLAYAGQVFSESLRLYPPAWVITRKAIETDDLFGYPIVAGALLIMSPYVIHRLPSFWKDAHAFVPERFESDVETEQHRYAYIPYGAGPRMCIGNHFAEVEAKLILAMVSRQFWLSLPPGKPPAAAPLVTLRPVGGLRMHVRKH
jgi:cytochrome P450